MNQARVTTTAQTQARAKEIIDVLELLADSGHCEWPTAERLNLTARMLEELQDHNKARVFRRAAVLLERREKSDK